MNEYVIRGGNRITGELRVCGGKNAVLPILAATVLNGSESVIHNCPKIMDTFISIKILEHIGCKVHLEGNTLIVDSSGVSRWDVPAELVGEMRSSIIFMGGMLGRLEKVNISYPGGCELGDRPIDLHIKSLQAMNAVIRETHGTLHCQTRRMTGAKIHLDRISVGATENIMLGAVMAEGETVIAHAAREPEIQDLQLFLNGMGADITGAGTDTIVIRGVKKLHGVEHCVMPDRIVAGTYLTAAAVTGGELTLTRTAPADLAPVISKLAEMGCLLRVTEGTVSIKAPPRLKYLPRLMTEPHPGFPTDMQAQFVTALAMAEGTSVVTETIFDSRNKHAAELKRMGADITLSHDGMTFVIRGREKLQGAVVNARDLRGGAALILAGLAAEGETIVRNTSYVERGYEQIEEALRSAGGDITLRKDEEAAQ